MTVLSRCQRFDLRRIEPEDMIAMLKRIAKAEDAEITENALALITRASEGSARDAQSLLDQAISHGAGETTAQQVRAMLGLADRGRVLDLFDLIMQGDAAGALAELSAQYADGADPMAVLRDLAEITHWISVIKITPDAANDPTVSPDERTRGQTMAGRLAMRTLTRMWQMLLNALEEVAIAPNSMMAAEMAVIRLTHVADLPSPEELVRKLQNTPPTAGPAATGGGSPPQAGASQTIAQPTPAPRAPQASGNGGATALALAPDTNLARFISFDSVVALIRHNRDVKLLIEVETCLRLVSYAPGRIEFAPTQQAPRDLASRLSSRLQAWTGARWAVSVVAQSDNQTIAETRDADDIEKKASVRQHPLVDAVFQAFPTAKIIQIRTPEDIAQAAAGEALPEIGEDWDPFEDE